MPVVETHQKSESVIGRGYVHAFQRPRADESLPTPNLAMLFRLSFGCAYPKCVDVLFAILTLLLIAKHFGVIAAQSGFVRLLALWIALRVVGDILLVRILVLYTFFWCPPQRLVQDPIQIRDVRGFANQSNQSKCRSIPGYHSILTFTLSLLRACSRIAHVLEYRLC